MKSFLSKTRENYHPNYREGSPTRALVWILAVSFILLIGKDIVSGISSVVTAPFFYVRHYIETSSATIPVFFRGRLELEAQIRDLQSQILAEEGRDATFTFFSNENEELRALFNASGTPQFLAGVISRPPYTPYDTLIIDKGDVQGILPYAPVYLGNHTAVGYVRTVFARTALVTLFSSPGAESTVYIFGPDIFTQAYGEGGGVIRLSVPQGMVVKEGDVVVLPSLEGGILGTVSHVVSVASDPEQHAYVLSELPIQSIRVVSVGSTPVRPSTFEEAEVRVDDIERTLFTFDIPEEYQATSTESLPLGATTTP